MQLAAGDDVHGQLGPIGSLAVIESVALRERLFRRRRRGQCGERLAEIDLDVRVDAFDRTEPRLAFPVPASGEPDRVSPPAMLVASRRACLSAASASFPAAGRRSRQ